MAKMMNEVTVMGRVLGEPRVNESNGRKYVNAVLANERSFDSGREEVNKIPVSLSGDAAERFLKEAKPETVIVVNGYFQSSEYQREDGSQGISYRLRGYDFYRLYMPNDAAPVPTQAIEPGFTAKPGPETPQAAPTQPAPQPTPATPQQSQAQSPFEAW